MLSRGSDIANYVVLSSFTRRVMYWRVTVIGAFKLLAMTVKLHLSVNVTVLHNFVPASAYVYVYVCMHVCMYVCMHVCM